MAEKTTAVVMTDHDFDVLVLEFRRLSPEQNQEGFAEDCGITCRHFGRMAARVAAADAEGYTLSIPPDHNVALRKIARKQLSLKAYHSFGGGPMEKYLPALPLGEQDRLADGGTVKVYSKEKGEFPYREVTPLSLMEHERQKVFSLKDGIRDAAGQRSWIETRKETVPRVTTKGNVIRDKSHHRILVRVGNDEVPITADELIEHFKAIS